MGWNPSFETFVCALVCAVLDRGSAVNVQVTDPNDLLGKKSSACAHAEADGVQRGLIASCRGYAVSEARHISALGISRCAFVSQQWFSSLRGVLTRSAVRHITSSKSGMVGYVARRSFLSSFVDLQWQQAKFRAPCQSTSPPTNDQIQGLHAGMRNGYDTYAHCQSNVYFLIMNIKCERYPILSTTVVLKPEVLRPKNYSDFVKKYICSTAVLVTVRCISLYHSRRPRDSNKFSQCHW